MVRMTITTDIPNNESNSVTWMGLLLIELPTDEVVTDDDVETRLISDRM